MTDSSAFEKLVADLDYPMYVVTTRGSEPAGCLVGFTTQASIDPPRFLVALSKQNHTYRQACDATHLAVHLIDRERLPLARLFGEQTDDKTDKFSRCRWHEGPAGMPILDEAAAWFVGEILDRFDLGDHVGHLLAPVDGAAHDGLLDYVSFSDVEDLDPGHDA